MLKILPNISFPITNTAINPLVEGMVQVNLIDGSLTDPQQRAMGIYLHVIDLWVKSKGKIDYRGLAGHERLKQDAKNFCSSDSILTRHGDLSAAHLAIDWHDTAVRMRDMKLPPPPNTVESMLPECIDLCGLSVIDEKRIGLLLDFCGKKQA